MQVVVDWVGKLSVTLFLSGWCLLDIPQTAHAQTLRLRLPLTDARGATATASDTSVGDVNITLGMFTNNVAVDLHGAQGTGVTNPAALNATRALDLTTNTAITQEISQPAGNGVGTGGASGVGGQNGAVVKLENSTGANSLATLGNNGSGNITNFTITLWFNKKYPYNASAAIGERFFVLNAGTTTGDKGAANALALYIQDKNYLEFTIGTSGYPAFAPTAITNIDPNLYANGYAVSNWYFAAVTYDGTNVVMYLGDLTHDAFAISTNALANQVTVLGAAASMGLGNRGNGQRGLNGWMQDFRFYNGAGDSNFVNSVRSELLTAASMKTTPALSVGNSPVIYGGSPQAAMVNGSVAGTVSNVKYNESATIPTAAGTYAITADFTPDDTADYNSLTGAPAGNFVINLATPTLSVGNSPVIYNGLPQAATVSSLVAGTVSNLKYNGSATIPTAAGTYAVTADFAPADTADYNSLTGAPAGSFVINMVIDDFERTSVAPWSFYNGSEFPGATGSLTIGTNSGYTGNGAHLAYDFSGGGKLCCGTIIQFAGGIEPCGHRVLGQITNEYSDFPARGGFHRPNPAIRPAAPVREHGSEWLVSTGRPPGHVR